MKREKEREGDKGQEREKGCIAWKIEQRKEGETGKEQIKE